LRRGGLDDEPFAFLAHDRFLPRELELPRNADGLIAAVLEDLHPAFGGHESYSDRPMS